MTAGSEVLALLLDLPEPLPWERMGWKLTGPAGGGRQVLGDLVLARSGDGSRAVLVREGAAPFGAGIWTFDLVLRLDVGAERRRGGAAAAPPPRPARCASAWAERRLTHRRAHLGTWPLR